MQRDIEQSSIPLNVLVVEDDQIHLKIMSDILSCQGYTVVTAKTLQEARQRIKESSSIQLALLDLNLPDGFGLSLVDTIRATFNNPVIILVTAAMTHENIDWAQKCGVKKVIAKPFTAKQLIDKIQKCL